MTEKILLKYSGKWVLVDDEDYPYLSQWAWGITQEGYVIRRTSRTLGDRKVILMHRELLNCPSNLLVDHIDGNRLNNQKGNLRICTNQQNQQNRGIPNNNTSGYKGVCRIGTKWRAQVQYNGKKIYLGLWDTPEIASIVYETECRRLFGEFYRNEM